MVVPGSNLTGLGASRAVVARRERLELEVTEVTKATVVRLPLLVHANVDAIRQTRRVAAIHPVRGRPTGNRLDHEALCA